ncbi:MAG UNVERIFIED_CONTAM: hypothetical protein LVT10_23315 [Anaerolineae bacterium]|jgi:glycine/D-amino acid oxidase-like deaminating enzyme
MTVHYDVIVVGLGAMGSATSYQLAQQGAQVLGLDRFHPPHEMGLRMVKRASRALLWERARPTSP